jgi:hypothetical protein
MANMSICIHEYLGIVKNKDPFGVNFYTRRCVRLPMVKLLKLPGHRGKTKKLLINEPFMKWRRGSRALAMFARRGFESNAYQMS